MMTFLASRINFLGLNSLIGVLLFAGVTNTYSQYTTAQTQAGGIKIVTLVDSLEHPWGMTFLPDGRVLLTERSGQLYVVSNDSVLSEPLGGIPEVFNQGQGGLLDVALDPDFANNQLVYLSFSEPGEGGTASTALGRGVLKDDRIEDFTVIFSQEPKVKGPNHFGGRIAFTSDGNLFLALGERFKFDPAQNLANHLGTIVRLKPDGSVPADNPFVDSTDAKNEIWSYGHRNIESAAIDPATNKLWVVEMGPLGGDELNQPVAGRNYGWPVVSWGQNYDGTDIPDPPTRPEFADAAIHWTPVIAPSGMIFYTGDMFPEWQGDAFIGGLVASGLVRVSVDDEQAKEEERIPLTARIRDVRQAPDGSLYVLTDAKNGRLLRLEALEDGQAQN